MEYILTSPLEIDVIQFPFNIFDCYRWKRNHLLEYAHKTKIKLYARSIFLQGLIFSSKSNEVISKLGAEKYISFLNMISKQRGLTSLELAFSYVNSIEQIDGMIIGCETVEQLKNNIYLFENNLHLPKVELDKIEDFMCDISEIIIDPRQW